MAANGSTTQGGARTVPDGSLSCTTVLYHFFTFSLPNGLPNSGTTWGHLAGSSLFVPLSLSTWGQTVALVFSRL